MAKDNSISYAVADFETTTIAPARVWVYGIVDYTEKYKSIGYSIDAFFEDAKLFDLIFFHNLRFDANFIENWLFRNGYVHAENTKPNELLPGTFSTLISDMGQYFSMSLRFDSGELVTFRDSLKLIPLPVKRIPKAFGLDIKKTSFDYDQANIDDGVKLDDAGKEYLLNDILIVNRALKDLFAMTGSEKFTQASMALAEYRSETKSFFKLFPDLGTNLSKYFLKAYRGGWVYLKPSKAGKVLRNMRVYDINSMYPTQMKNEAMPIGHPKRYNANDYDNIKNELYIGDFIISGKIKRDYLPTLQIKGDKRYKATEYVTKIYHNTHVTLTSVDVEMLHNHYNLDQFIPLAGFKFNSRKHLFDDYLNKFMTMKEEAGRSGNSGMRFIAKIFLNSLYGKFGSNPMKASKVPELNSEGAVIYKTTAEEETKSVYVPVSAFITAYARREIINSAQANYNDFVYADTDSLHMLANKNVVLKQDSQKLGYWKEESHEDGFVKRAKFLRAKTYVEEYNDLDPRTKRNILNVKAAGLPEGDMRRRTGKQGVTFDNFKIGAIYGGKLMPKHVPGGTILEETEFTIK